MKSKVKTTLLIGAALSMGFAGTATAFEPGDWLVRVGASYVNPSSDNSDIVSVDSDTSVTLNLTYMMTNVWALELLAAVPFKHDIDLLNGSKVGSTKHLPPTLSLQYHFMPTEQFQPYVGFGINYTNFYSEKTTGDLEGVNLDLGDSWGLAGQIGFDVLFNDDWFFNLDVRYIDIDTKARLDGVSIGRVEVDPWIFGGHIGYRF
jgi:outer membrane protein